MWRKEGENRWNCRRLLTLTITSRQKRGGALIRPARRPIVARKEEQYFVDTISDQLSKLGNSYPNNELPAMAYVALSRHSNCIWCAFMIINSCWQFFQSEQTFSMSFHLNYSSIGETRGTPFRPSTPSFPSGRPQLAKRATLTKSSVENGFEILPLASKVSFTREIWSVVMSKTDPDPFWK